MLERSHLVIIREVERQGTLTAAAQALCLSQSALSHAIHKLEHQSGVRLWHKRGRKLCLTDSGKMLLKLAQSVLPQLEQVEAQFKEVAEGDQGRLTLGVECYPCYRWLQKIITPFLKEWPNVTVDIKQQFRFSGVEALLQRYIDVLLTPDPVEHEELTYVPVKSFEQVLVVSERNSLAEKPWVQAQDLKPLTLITYPIPEQRLDIYTEILLPVGVRPLRRKEIEATDIILEMVSQGLGVAALPDWLVLEYQHLGLKAISLGAAGIHKSLYLGLRTEDMGMSFHNGLIQLAKSLSTEAAQ